MILKVKKINKITNYKYFKMESTSNVINLIKPNVYMTSIDLKNAFFSVSIHNDHQKYLCLCLEICFNLHPCLMFMYPLWEYLLKYQKYLLHIFSRLQLSCIRSWFIATQINYFWLQVKQFFFFRIHYIVEAYHTVFNWWKEK